MNSYLEVKEIVNGIQKIMKGNTEAKEIVDLLRIVSFLVVCATFVIQYCGFAFSINIGAYPTRVNQFLDKYAFMIFIGLIFYKVIGSMILRKFVIGVNVKCDINLLPAFNTVEEVFEIGTMFILLLELSKNLFLGIRGVNVIETTDRNMYLTYLICCFGLFINWLYVKNKNYWYLAAIRYTPYFDCAGKRIAQDDRVVYYGRLYYIYLFDVEERLVSVEKKTRYSQKEWYLSKTNSGIIHKEILLEDAVRDEKGKIKVYEYGVGKKRNSDK